MKLQRDSHGCIFLDVNFVCFQANMVYLNEVTISSEVYPPNPPLFGILDKVTMVEMSDSNIVKDEVHRSHSSSRLAQGRWLGWGVLLGMAV